MINEIEKRFKEVSNISDDISYFPLKKSSTVQVETDKEKSDEFGEVFTPLWLVDEMLQQTDWNKNKITLDLCAGYGQFTIRMIRKYANENSDFDIDLFLSETHHFSELQLDSCFKLYYIFGSEINLHIGDSTYLSLLPDNARGINFFSSVQNKWIDVSEQFENEFQLCFVKKIKATSDVNLEPFMSYQNNSDFF